MNIFNTGIQYLKENIPCLTNNENWHNFESFYFTKPDYSSLENAFFEIPNSMYSQRRGKFLRYAVNEASILKILHGDAVKKTCDFKYIYQKYGNDYQKLVSDLKKEIGFEIKNDNPNMNSWVVFSKSICNSAIFMSQFKDFNGLVSYCTKETPAERLDVADKILKQQGAGSKELIMTLNWLKDIGIPGYCKPDLHLCRIITGIFKEEFLSEGKPYTSTNYDDWTTELPSKVKVQKDVFIKASIQSDEDGADLFAFDRLLYLIGSADFYGTDSLSQQIKAEYVSKVHGQDKDNRFIEYVLNHQ